MEENISQKEKEKAEEEMIEQAFQELLNDYLATKHRKRVEIITGQAFMSLFINLQALSCGDSGTAQSIPTF